MKTTKLHHFNLLNNALRITGKPLLSHTRKDSAGNGSAFSFVDAVIQTKTKSVSGEIEHAPSEPAAPMLHSSQLEIFKKEISESLRYAQSLQKALLQEKNELKEMIPQSFILFQPKQTVSGDFYWFKSQEDKVFVAVGDCTGHGIPGALLTMMALNALHAAFNFQNISSPPLLLKFLDEDFNRKLSHKSKGKVMSDSMDLAICEIDKKEMTLTISGAGCHIFLVRDEEIFHFRPDIYHIGNADPGKQFDVKHIPLKKGDSIYLSSDGYIDQFGGTNRKKLGSRKFRELLVPLSKEPFNDRKAIMKELFVKWQGNQEQTDDVLVMGLSV